YCHRCAMFFNGETVSEAAPVEFFTENSFYTTSASRMARNIIPSAITADHVITACGGTPPQKPAHDDNTPWRTDDDSKSEHSPKRKISWLRKLGGFFSLIFFILSAAACFGKNPIAYFFGERQLVKYILLAASAAAFAVFCGKNQIAEQTSHRSARKLSKRTIAAAVMILLAVPVTIYFGVYYLGDKKYLFISLLVMLECMLPFFLVFEGRKPQARELVIISVLCALAVAGRAAFYMLPQFKPVMAIVIISGAAFGGETGFLVGALTMLVSNMFFGQGPWTPWQMFAMGITGFLAGVLFQKGLLGRNKSAMAVFGLFAAVVIYGGIMNPASAVMAHLPLNKGILLTYYAAGLPMDIVHGVSTMLFLFVGAKPMLEKLDRVKIKYGLL
ncbi:MAG: ECF transporter S component, partial [Oscillospiraceae bacterium]